MLSKQMQIYTLRALLLVAILAGMLVLSGIFESDNPTRIRIVMRLTEMARPPLVEHTEIVTSPQIISYPRPELTVDDKILGDLNCPPGENGVRYCGPFHNIGQFASLGCYSIDMPDPLLGGLNPAYPMAECSVGNGKYVYQASVLISVGVAYIIERQGNYVLIDSMSELKATFAPIETENEALSYAMAATGYFAFYGMEISSDTEYYVEKLENTHVEVREGEYVVRLYHYNWGGCGYHETIAIDVAVSDHGNIREIYREVVYRDINNKCQD